MIDLEILGCEVYERPGGEDVISLMVNVTDGTNSVLHKFVFPADTFEWRVAEYDLDDWNADQLVELILMEHFMPQVDESHPFTLFNAPTRAEAKAFHIARLEGAKNSHLRVTKPAPALRAQALARATGKDEVDVDDTDPMDLVRQFCKIDPEVVKIKRELVESKRARLAQNGQNMDRLQRFRMILEKEKGTDGNVHQ